MQRSLLQAASAGTSAPLPPGQRVLPGWKKPPCFFPASPKKGKTRLQAPGVDIALVKGREVERTSGHLSARASLGQGRASKRSCRSGDRSAGWDGPSPSPSRWLQPAKPPCVELGSTGCSGGPHRWAGDVDTAAGTRSLCHRGNRSPHALTQPGLLGGGRERNKSRCKASRHYCCERLSCRIAPHSEPLPGPLLDPPRAGGEISKVLALDSRSRANRHPLEAQREGETWGIFLSFFFFFP